MYAYNIFQVDNGKIVKLWSNPISPKKYRVESFRSTKRNHNIGGNYKKC